MKTLFSKAEGMNFKKAFITFFAALLGFGVIYFVVMAATGNWSEASVLLERLTFARLRGRMFTDVAGTFRFFGHLFLIGFNVLLAMWVYVDGKKHSSHKKFYPILTLFTGLIGWLVYMISRVDRTDRTIVNSQEN
jgi:hypothetical protein